jgi:hypothetical protein
MNRPQSRKYLDSHAGAQQRITISNRLCPHSQDALSLVIVRVIKSVLQNESHLGGRRGVSGINRKGVYVTRDSYRLSGIFVNRRYVFL